MSLKERILKWLGFDVLTTRIETQAMRYEQQLAEIQAAHATALETAREDIRAEYEARLVCVVEASITASERIARMVAEKGDSNLKAYIDGCLESFIPTPFEHMN